MRFSTIWSLPGLSLRERIDRTLDLLAMLVYDILPKRIRYWVAMRAIGHATRTSQNVPATSLDNILENLGRIRDGKELVAFEWHESKRHTDDDHSVHINVNPQQLAVDNIVQNTQEQIRRHSGRLS